MLRQLLHNPFDKYTHLSYRRSMLSQKLLSAVKKYALNYQGAPHVVMSVLPILYFGDIEAYSKSDLKVVTVGKNPSDNEFREKKSDPFSFIRFPLFDPQKWNLEEALNTYFYDGQKPLWSWFSCFEPILNGLGVTYRDIRRYQCRAIHTDICTPLATSPTWSLLTTEQQKDLMAQGFPIWRALIEELSPDLMLISIPRESFVRLLGTSGTEIMRITAKQDGGERKKPYLLEIHNHKLQSGKIVHVLFGEAANTPFGTISNEQKLMVGNELSRLIGASKV